MKRSKSLFLVGPLVLTGCSSPGGPAATTAPPATAAATPVPTPKSDTGAPVPLPLPTDPDETRRRRVEEMVQKLSGGEFSEQEKLSGEYQVVKDPKTGKDQHRILRSGQYYVLRDRLYNVVMKDHEGLVIAREDKDAWYVDVPVRVAQDSARTEKVDEVKRDMLIDVPEIEVEVVQPPISPSTLRFEDLSEGLPVAGIWRENFDLGDLDGDGRPEIVAPPPRLSGREMQIFKWDGKAKRWNQPTPVYDDPERLGFEYGGVAVGDMDGDRKADIVFGKHGGGPAIAFNQGGFKFRIESRGLPKKMTTRAMAIGDLDADGKPDVVAVSDEPEYIEVKRLEAEGKATARLPGEGGYVLGFDTRAFLQEGGRYVEVNTGLDASCFGYSIGVFAPAPDRGRPFLASSCRYVGLQEVVREYDPKEKKFTAAGADIVESLAVHLGTAMGLYKGHPASFQTYTKSTPQGAVRNATGNGISIYYRDGSEWKRKRLVKSIAERIPSQAIAVGDLDGNGLDDAAFADESVHRVRVFFQLPSGEFEELAAERQPTYANHGTSARIADVDGDKKNDIVLMHQYLTGDPSRAGGLRFFRNLGSVR